MRLYAIDGACRRNGKPDCTSSGGVFMFSEKETKVLSDHEHYSTNQRGELYALRIALLHIMRSKQDARAFNVLPETYYVATDSEYIFNAMTKEWYINWHNKGWVTASGGEVKNKDIWTDIYYLMQKLHEYDTDLLFYHIKGHCIPFGRVTAENLMAKDPTGATLYKEVCKKFDSCRSTKANVFEAAQQLSERNNGFRLPECIFKKLVVCNTMADIVATIEVDKADASRKG